MNRRFRPAVRLSSVMASSAFAALMIAAATPATAQISSGGQTSGRALDLAPDSPFRDPDLIYLEADEVINDENAQVLTAIGEVEGRYEDRTLRADRVDYDLTTGSVLATGNVVLIDSTGDVQYAQKIELSDELLTGTAANYTARLATGATTAARFVTRDADGEFELYNVTYTACEVCEASEAEGKRPTWRLRARRVKQDNASRTIRYKDAVLEMFGIPVFYTPYLAHPDPSKDRASGLLFPTIGLSDSRGFTYAQPYYWAIDDYSELTVTPRIFSGVNPLLNLQARRKFATGEINAEGSFTYGTPFDDRGNSLDNPALFSDPADAESGDQLSGHIFVDGFFKPTEEWHYGYTGMLQSDDIYLDRYGLSASFLTNGLIANEPRINTNQAFIAGQGENYRLSVMAAAFQSTRSRLIRDDNTDLLRRSQDNGDRLPVIAPIIQGEYFIQDPVVGGRLRAYGDITYLTRETGNDYGRATLGGEYSKTWIVPGGVEVKPFAWGRFDNYDLQTQAETDIGFSRGIGQAGLDVRYPFVRPGRNFDLVFEPRAQFTESFGNAKIERFTDPANGVSIIEDGFSPDLDVALLFESNKADGFDFFENGRRLDVGATVSAEWRMGLQDSKVALFAGRSFADNVDNVFGNGSGLSDSSSDYVFEAEVDLGRYINAKTLVRYDEDRNELSRVDSNVRLGLGKFAATGRYYRLDNASTLTFVDNGPIEALQGGVSFGPVKGWSTRYNAEFDLEDNVIRSHRASLRYQDDCTSFDFFFTKRNSDNVLVNDTEIGFRVSLKTLGEFGSR